MSVTPATLPTVVAHMNLTTLDSAEASVTLAPHYLSLSPHSSAVCDPGDTRCAESTHHPGALGSDSSNIDSSKAQVTWKAKTVTTGHQTAPLAEAVEGKKCQYSKIARGSSGKRNQKLVLYCHLLKNKKKGL